MEGYLFQKTGVAIGQLALDLLSRNEGERIPTVSEYQEKFGVSRGTIQNAFKYLKDNGRSVLGIMGIWGLTLRRFIMGNCKAAVSGRNCWGLCRFRILPPMKALPPRFIWSWRN